MTDFEYCGIIPYVNFTLGFAPKTICLLNRKLQSALILPCSSCIHEIPV
jgi:hypothetical protein